MSTSKSKTKTKEQTQVRPTNPPWVTGGVQNLQEMINRLSKTDPSQYVAPSSPLQNAAFGIAGGIANRMGFAPPVSDAGFDGGNMSDAPTDVVDMGSLVQAGGGGNMSAAPSETATGILGMAGSGASAGTPDWNSYIGNNPDLQTELSRLNANYGQNSTLDTNGDGRIAADEYGPWHDTNYNQANNEGRAVPTTGITMSAPTVQGRNITPDMMGQVGATELAGPNPYDYFSQAGGILGNVGGAGANLADTTFGNATYGNATYGNATYGNATYGNATYGDAALVDLENLRDRGLSKVQAASLLDNIDAYMNPYIDDVVDTSLAGFDEMSGRRDAALKAEAAGSRALGGSRYGLQRSNFLAQEDLSRGMLESGLRSDAFNTGAALSADDANRRQSASAANAASANQARAQEYDLYGRSLLGNMDAANAFGMANMDAANAFGMANMDAANTFGMANMDAANTFGMANMDAANTFGLANMDAANTFGLANMDAANTNARFNAGQRDTALNRQLQSASLLESLGSTIGAEDRANLGILAGLGEQQRGIESEYRNAEPMLAQLIAMLQSQQPYGLFGGQDVNSTGTSTTRETSIGKQDATDAAKAAAIMFSDARLKEDVQTAGYDAKGRRWVDFSYIGDPTRHRGVIAQEVAKTDPDAVIEHESGFLQVDYSKLN